MNEREYSARIVKSLAALRFDCQRHEDKYENFIPDVSYAVNGTDGWVEFKYAHNFIASLSSVKHVTRGQIDWLTRRGKAGSGHSYLWLGIGTEVSIVWQYTVLDKVYDMPIIDAINLSAAHGHTADVLIEFKNLHLTAPAIRGG